MNDIALAFVTGITTGGLSCLAVQGGLLAASIAKQVEQDLSLRPIAAPDGAQKARARRVAAVGNKRKSAPIAAVQPPRVALPIVLFLGTKLIAYTILGLLLGQLGSLVQLTPMARAALQLAIGVFMVGNALRMLNVHPIFRYFNIEPPQFITRYIRRRAKQSADVVTPAFLGFLTVLIPCGVTQAMMALALGTGNAVQGATLMFAFTLGTTPVFFVLAYLATRLGASMEKRFSLVAAAVLLILGVVSIEGGLRLTGLPVWQTASANSEVAVAPVGGKAALPADQPAAPAQAAQALTINVRANGYEPSQLLAKAGQPLKLSMVTNKTYSCARAFVIPALNIQRVLPDTGTVVFDIPAQRAGSTLNFTCSMGMYGGQIKFN